MPQPADTTDLIYDWNEVARRGRVIPPGFTFFDETLRDGLQNPSVRDPSIEPKLKLLHLMHAIGIHSADIGLPGSSKRAFDDVLRMCREIVDHKLKVQPAAAGRTVVGDIVPMVEISQRAGIPLEVYTFIGSSAIRQLVEDWSVDLLARRAGEAIDVAVKNGLPVAFVTEDTSRSRPEVLATLYKVAIDHGATRLCVCDTAGHSTPDGVRNLLGFTRAIIAGMGASGTVKIDWHGHNDRGLALVNAIYALENGADRVHATALGVGERVGNAPMELLLLNLKLLGVIEDQDLTRLLEYCTTAADAVGWQIPINYPLAGRDAFRTATGVHASAIIKAQQKGDSWLSDRIYSGVPAAQFGREQEIVVGFMSGASNVSHVLRRLGLEASKEHVDAVLQAAKATDHILSDDEIRAAVGATPLSAPGCARWPARRPPAP
ncbi:MAG: 2-isopropylmalate synthase [Myxococcales bacterium]|nr:MAG: 2-isopropylmalate synthase [Myxococcales bacterium]